MWDRFAYTPALVAEVIDLGVKGTSDLDVVELVADVETALRRLPRLEASITIRLAAGDSPAALGVVYATSSASIQAVASSTHARVAQLLNG